MVDVTLETDALRLVASTQGGVVWSLHARHGEGYVPVLRQPPAGDARLPVGAACFPLVPFGNRLRGDRFSFGGRDYVLRPNTPWDRHYLHGDGWLAEWEIAAQGRASVTLTFGHGGEASPYRYEAAQTFALDGERATLALTVVNRGAEPLPFGIGWHPYLPLDSDTTLLAPAARYWTEGAGFLPEACAAVPEELDFSVPRVLPRHWVNNGFEGWSGRAEVEWPARGGKLLIEADRPTDRYFLFVSDPGYDPAYTYEYFCFEPMSHGADAHHAAGQGGLVTLAPGAALSGALHLTWKAQR